MEFKTLTWKGKLIGGVCVVVLVFAAYVFGVYRTQIKYQAREDALEAAYSAQKDKLAALSEDRALAVKDAANWQEKYEIAIKNADKKVQEAGTNAYKSKINMPDSAVDAAWDAFLAGVKQRNAERGK